LPFDLRFPILRASFQDLALTLSTFASMKLRFGSCSNATMSFFVVFPSLLAKKQRLTEQRQ
jgi:hypothetical protein